MGEVFETERNRFFYPLEPDNVYLRGDFDIEAAGILSSTPGFHSLQQARFTVTPPTPKVWKDLTPQGLWFYRGDAALTFTVTAIPGTRTILSLKDLHAALAVWEVNGRTGPLFQAPFEADLTGCLQPERTRCACDWWEPTATCWGPITISTEKTFSSAPVPFRGERGFEDFVSPWIRHRQHLDGRICVRSVRRRRHRDPALRRPPRSRAGSAITFRAVRTRPYYPACTQDGELTIQEDLTWKSSITAHLPPAICPTIR